jgi:protein-tyrosine phosphatase
MPEPLQRHSSRATAERRAARLLQGASNFRDIGGCPVPDGLRVRYGMVFRSSELSRLTEADLAVLRELGIRLVFDLRGEVERLHRPSRWPEGMSTELLLGSVLADIRAGSEELRKILLHDATADGARRMMLATYRLLPTRSAAGLGQLLRKLADDCLPAVVHCTAGKDRTGFVCACLQLALGVPRPTVYADYLLSGEYLDLDDMAVVTGEVIAKQLRVSASREMLDVINSVAPEYLDAAFASIDEDFSSMSAYLAHCGIDGELLRRLRSGMLEPDSAA